MYTMTLVIQMSMKTKEDVTHNLNLSTIKDPNKVFFSFYREIENLS